MAKAEAAGAAVPRALVLPDALALRSEFERLVVGDLVGPAGGAEEEIAESSVRDRYLVGVLAPRDRRVEPEESDDVGVEQPSSGEDGESDPHVAPRGSLAPSSLGLTFAVSAGARALRVDASWGRYERVPSRTLTGDDGGPVRVWARTPAGGTVTVPLVAGEIGPLALDPATPEVVVTGRVRTDSRGAVVSLFLVNGQAEPERARERAWLFQVGLAVRDEAGAAVFVRRRPRAGPGRLDPRDAEELRAWDMLDRDQVEFAVGHGVAVHAEVSTEDPERAFGVETRVLPAFEVPQQAPPSNDEEPLLAGLVLDMRELADAPRGRLVAGLQPVATAYEDWIRRQEARIADPATRLSGHEEAAREALARCRRALDRIRGGLALLAHDPHAEEAFRFANRAMWLQRVRTVFAEGARRGEPRAIEAVDVPANRSWRTFQLAFVLLNLQALTRLDHPDRVREATAVADLLWFPTGGGKTEAYLGLAAYAMAIRRLQGEVGGRSGEHGVAVLMRYTLRLLTLQQFQRASTLVCACEAIRREAEARGDPRLGREPFRIGLWVGLRTTPNTTDQAAEALKQVRGDHRGGPGPGLASPAQLTACPWCGHRIDPGRDIEVESLGRGAGRTFTFCGDPRGECPFSRRGAPREGLPVVVVDEEIFRLLPALLIGTVDKFAQLPWRGPTQMLFGQVDRRCPRHGFRSADIEDQDSHPRSGELPAVRAEPHPPLRPPDLVIQDELHLISGPLGTLTGLYETAVDALSTWEVGGVRVRPKVVASTATVRRAGDQVSSLFLRDVEVFPPSGLDSCDNFFSRRRPASELPGRRYLGVCAPGRRMKAAMIRVYVACLAAAQTLYQKYGRAADPWMTVVGYFNSVRELAGMRRMVEDDVRSRLRDVDRRGLARRPPPFLEELTSRRSAADIPRLLDRLEVGFDPAIDEERRAARRRGERFDRERPIDVVLATNMVSVGVDVRRLGLMVVQGQPKATAEYIQATSRVGRAWPGIVLTVFNWARPRDLSHYERFEHYHATFYQHVEALSVTPFAQGAVDRGLAGVLVSLVRLSGKEFNANGAAQRFDSASPVVARALDVLARRASLVSGDVAAGQEVRERARRLVDVWSYAAHRSDIPTGLVYGRQGGPRDRRLLAEPGVGDWTDFTCLTSLREVEPTVGLVLRDGGLDG